MERYLRYIDVAKKYKSFGPIYVKNKCIYIHIYIYMCVCVCVCVYRFPWWLTGKVSCQCRRCRFNPWVGIYPGEGNGSPFQYFCLGNPKNRGTTFLGVTNRWT